MSRDGVKHEIEDLLKIYEDDIRDVPQLQIIVDSSDNISRTSSLE